MSSNCTVFAQLISVVASIFVLFRKNLPISFSMRQCKIYREELKAILNIGIPMAVQETMVQISFLVVNTVINQMGLIQSAGYGVAYKIVTFMMLVPSSVMQSVSAFVAQNVGAGKADRAWKGFVTAIVSGCTAGILICIAAFWGGGAVSSFFTKEVDVISQSANYLKGFCTECILSCVLFSSVGYFNGHGRSIPVMIQGISSACIRIILAVFFSRLANTSLMLVGIATPITTVYGIIFFSICFIHLKRSRGIEEKENENTNA